MSAWWHRNRAVVAFAAFGLLAALGIFRVEGEVDRRCSDSRESREALRVLAQDLAEPLAVTMDADPSLRAQVEERNQHFAERGEGFLARYPDLSC